MPDAARATEIKQPERPKLREIMGPGLITGASDDDPSGIATYSQAPDHPIIPMIPETEYLKGFAFELVR